MPRCLAGAVALLCAGTLAQGVRWGGGGHAALPRREPPVPEPPADGAPLHGAAEAVARLEAAVTGIWEAGPARGRARYVVWREGGPGAGWGNRFRGMTSALLLGLLSKRRFLIDHGDFFDVFSDPGNASTLDYRNLAVTLRALREELLPRSSPVYRQPISLSQQAASVRGRSFRDGGTCGHLLQEALRSDADVLVHQCGCSFEREVLASPSKAVRRELLSIFGTLRQDALVEVMARYLTKRPRPILAQNAARVLRNWKRQAYDGFAMVQDRQWTDVHGADRGGKEQGTDRPHLNCTYKRLEAYRSALPGGKRLLIGVTSDSAAYAEQMMRALAPLGDVRRNVLFTDNSISYEASTTPLGARQFIIDWYILREAPFAVCTGSTYCVSARASGGLGNDGRFPYASDRQTYRQGGPFCYGPSKDTGDQLSIDTLSHPLDGRVFW